MADHVIHDLGVVFANMEILDLCNSIKDIHLALGALGRVIDNLKAPVFSKSNAFPMEFHHRGRTPGKPAPEFKTDTFYLHHRKRKAV